MTKIEKNSLFDDLYLVLIGGLLSCTAYHCSSANECAAANDQTTTRGNGAIFQTASYRPLYEDVKARMVGDVLTINLSEKPLPVKRLPALEVKRGQFRTQRQPFLDCRELLQHRAA